MRILWTAAAILGCCLVRPVLAVQSSEGGSTSMTSEFWAIIAVGGTLATIGITCLVMLVSLTSKVANVRERLAGVEATLKIRTDESDDTQEREGRFVEELSYQLARRLAEMYGFPPFPPFPPRRRRPFRE